VKETGLHLIVQTERGLDFCNTDTLENCLTPRECLLDVLLELSAQVDSKRAELEKLDTEYVSRLACNSEQIGKEEKYRDELADEVNQLKLKLHLLATDLKGVSSGAPDLKSIFRSFSGGSSDTSGDFEMKLIRSMYQSNGTHAEALQRTRDLENKLMARDERIEGLKKLQASLSNQMRQLEDENARLSGNCKDAVGLAVSEAGDCQKVHGTEAQDEATLRQVASDHMLAAVASDVDSSEGVTEENCEGGRKDGDTSGIPTKAATRIVGEDISDDVKAAEKTKGEAMSDNSEDRSVEEEQQADGSGLQNKTLLSPVSDSDSTSYASASTHSEIRSHAKNLLTMVDLAIGSRQKKKEAEINSSVQEAGKRDVAPAQDIGPIIVDRVPVDQGEVDDAITCIAHQKEQEPVCACTASDMFSKKEYVEFYLPKIGISCTCGRKQEVQLEAGGDPCALRNILRQWQVDFLSSVNIQDAVDFLHTYQQRRGLLAKEMKRWRRDMTLPIVKTDSCAIALHVWSHTCKAVIKAVAEQRERGATALARPEFLDVCIDHLSSE
jgi:hypothetical protein